MAKLTMVFAVLLLTVGVAGYLVTGGVHRTTLAPAVFGAGLFICGALADTEDRGRRMVWMHLAVTLGLLGSLGSAYMALKQYREAGAGPLAEPIVVEEWAAMSLICAIFVALCVRSFIAARRGTVTAP